MNASIAKGQVVEFVDISRITRDQLRAYSDASGDPNPIHLDDEIARQMGLPGVIAHGMLTAAFIAERGRRFFKDHLSEKDGWRMKRFNSRFKAMTFPDDVISVGGEVKEASEERIVLDLQAKNQRGEVTTNGVVAFTR